MANYQRDYLVFEDHLTDPTLDIIFNTAIQHIEDGTAQIRPLQ